MFAKYHALAVATLVGLGAFALPTSSVSAAALPYIQQNTGLSDDGLRQNVNDWGEEGDNHRGDDEEHTHRGDHDHWENGGWDNGGWDDGWRRYRRHDEFNIYLSPGYGYDDSYEYNDGYGYNTYHRRTHAHRCLSRYHSYSGRVHTCRRHYRY